MLSPSISPSAVPAAAQSQQPLWQACGRCRRATAFPAQPAAPRQRSQPLAAAVDESRAATVPPPPQQDAHEGGSKPEQLLAALASTSSYNQLHSLVQSQQQVFLQTPVFVYALLHALQLRDTLSDQQLGKGLLASEQQVLQQMSLVEELLEQLCDAAAQQLPLLPLQTQGTVALALAQLDYYHAATYDAITQTVLRLLAEKLPPQQPAAAPPGSPDDNNRSSSSNDLGIARSAALAALPDSLVPGVVLSLCVAMSLNGHHNQALLDALAEQAIAFQGCFPDAAPLISLSAALLDLQHFCPALLAAAAELAVRQEASLQHEEVISLLLALGFFRVTAPDFVQLALQALADDAEACLQLEPLQLSRLWKALLLLRDQGVTPPQQLLQVLSAVQQAVPDLLLLGRCQAALELEDLEAVRAADDVIRQHWEDAGLLAPVQILQEVQQLGYELQHEVEVEVPVAAAAAAGQLPGQQQRQEPGDAATELQLQLPPAVVDVCLQLPDQRHVAVLVLDEGRYCNSPSNRLRGGAAVDVLVLQALGLAVLPLPVAEWQALAGDVAQQQRYLKARLAAATC